MKKKVLSLILLATMMMSIFTGCGNEDANNEVSGDVNEDQIENESKVETMTVSEMVNHVLGERGEVVFYTGFNDDDSYLSYETESEKFRGVNITTYNGNTFLNEYHVTGDLKLKDAILNTWECELLAKDDVACKLDVITDNTGSICLEYFYDPLEEDDGTTNPYVIFGRFKEHVEIEGQSFMLFESPYYNISGGKPLIADYHYTLVEDTNETIDKAIIYDEIGTENVTYGEYKHTGRNTTVYHMINPEYHTDPNGFYDYKPNN